jgi:asparagine synthase (glutamine-hydrolysing)
VERAEKRGFGVPLDEWFKQDGGKSFAADRLLSEQALKRGWWNAIRVRAMLDVHARGNRREFGGMIWRLLMLDTWARWYYDDSSFLTFQRRLQ